MKLKDIYIRDPYILCYDKKFYLYGTTDEQCWKGKAFGFKCYVSNDFENFEEYTIFKNNESFWADEQFWAPEVHVIDGKFVMFASFSKDGLKRHSQILVSDSPLGPFVPKDHTLFKGDFSYLDATYFEEDKKRYVIFCYEWTDCKDGKMCIAELDKNLDVKQDKYFDLFKASDAAWTIDKEAKDCYVTDGPFLIKENDQYFLLWSSHSKDGYAMGYATSKNIMGPYTQRNEPLIKSDGGHGMIFKKDDQYYLTYHQPNFPHMMERVHYRKIKFENNEIKLLNEGE